MAIVNHSGKYLCTVSSMAMVEGEKDKEYRIYRLPGHFKDVSQKLSIRKWQHFKGRCFGHLQ